MLICYSYRNKEEPFRRKIKSTECEKNDKNSVTKINLIFVIHLYFCFKEDKIKFRALKSKKYISFIKFNQNFISFI